MEKMAIFVEGQTEQTFVQKLIEEISVPRQVHIDTVHAEGGRRFPRRFVEVEATRPDPHAEFYVIIYDSSNDSRVLSDIRDHYDNLVSQGFRAIVAIRDVYPEPTATASDIRDDFATLAPSTAIPPLLVLAIREIEAWFIADHAHFAELDTALSLAAITAELGYNPSTHDVQTIDHPAVDLGRAYALAGLAYNKSRRHVQRTVDALDYEAYYITLPDRIPDLKTLVGCLDTFFSL